MDNNESDLTCWEMIKDEDGDFVYPVNGYLVDPDDFNRNYILNDDPSRNDPLFPGLFGSWVCKEDQP